MQSRNNPVNLAGTVFPEVFDLERVEVLRGPQGTLFGAGAEGGVSWQTGDTFTNANWSDAGGARAALLWKASDALTITPSVLYQGSHDNDTPDYWSALSGPSGARFVNGYAARQQSTEHFVLPSLKVEADLGAVLLTSVTSFFYRSESNVSDVTNYDIAGALGAVGANNIFPTVASGAPVTDLFLGATYQNIVTQELRLQSSDPHARIRWVGGLYFQNSRVNDTQLAPNPQLENLFNEQQGPDAFQGYYYDPTTTAATASPSIWGTRAARVSTWT